MNTWAEVDLTPLEKACAWIRSIGWYVDGLGDPPSAPTEEEAARAVSNLKSETNERAQLAALFLNCRTS